MKRPLMLTLVCVVVLLSACQPGISPLPTISPIIPTPENSPLATPILEPVDAETALTPSASHTSDPLALLPPGVTKVAPAFRLEPLTTEAMEATGEGPVGFTLVVVDSTSGARILAQGQAGPDGKFRFPLSEKPALGHVVGLTVDLNQEQLASEAFMRLLFDARGPGFRIVPRIVTVFDSVEVERHGG